MNVIALACVAMMESPMAYHGMVLPAEKKSIYGIGSAAAPQAVGNQENQPTGENRPVGMAHREK